MFVITGLGHSKNSGIGGSDKRAIEIINNLNNENYKSYILCPSNSINTFNGHLKKKVQYILIDKNFSIDIFSEKPIGRLLDYIDIILFKNNILIQDNFDLIYSTSDCISDVKISINLSKKYKIEKIAMLHHRIPNPFNRKGNFLSNCFSFLMQKYTNHILKNNFKNLLFYKTPEGKLFSEYFFKNKFYVNNGIEIDNFKLKKNKIYELTFIGGLRFSKGIEDLIKIAVELKKRNKFNRPINVYGGGSQKIFNYFDKQINKFQIKDLLIVHGPQDKNKIKEILSNTKILLLPSYEEGWSIIIYEALFYGCEIIAYDLPALSQINSYIHLVNNNKEMLKMVDLISNSNARLKPRPDKKFFNNYSWKNVAFDEETIFKRILG